MGDIKLATPRLRFLREGFDPLEVQVTNADLVQWDVTRGKQRWPKLTEAAFLGQTFLAWHAARRTGAIPTDLKWETFLATVLQVEEIQDDDEDDEDSPGNPTQPGPASDLFAKSP